VAFLALARDEILRRVVRGDKQIQEAISWWKNREWGTIGASIVIQPFDCAVCLGVCNYDLRVGPEYVSLRNPYDVRSLEDSETFTVSPGETVLILSEEYLCLPLDLMGMVVPRARLLFEGASLHATRVDPSWYGRLLIGLTNVQRYPIALSRGEPFCTVYFDRVDPPLGEGLTPKDVPALGRERIGRMAFAHARPEELVGPESVTMQDLDQVVREFGKPWDVVRGALRRSQEEVKQYLDKDLGPNIAEEASKAAYKRAFGLLEKVFMVFVAALVAVAFRQYLT